MSDIEDTQKVLLEELELKLNEALFEKEIAEEKANFLETGLSGVAERARWGHILVAILSGLLFGSHLFTLLAGASAHILLEALVTFLWGFNFFWAAHCLWKDRQMTLGIEKREKSQRDLREATQSALSESIK